MVRALADSLEGVARVDHLRLPSGVESAPTRLCGDGLGSPLHPIHALDQEMKMFKI